MGRLLWLMGNHRGRARSHLFTGGRTGTEVGRGSLPRWGATRGEAQPSRRLRLLPKARFA